MKKEEEKKPTTKKKVEKEQPKKETKKEVKRETKKVEDKSSAYQERALTITFILLSILVIILLVVALVKKNQNELKEESHITIPVLQENTTSTISISLKEYNESEETEYVFVVSNYREDQILDTALDYDINVTNNDDIKIELYKNGGTKNLLEEDLEVEDNKLKKDKKQEDVYRLVIERTDAITDSSEIKIEIES